MPSTYDPIATTTLGSAAADITFSSIPTTWTDLRLVVEAKSPSGNNGLFTRVNSDTTTLYSTTLIYGSGTSTLGGTNIAGDNKWYTNYGSYATTTRAQLLTVDIFSYANTSVFKTACVRSGNAVQGVDLMVCLYRSTAAISSVSVYFLSANLPAGTTATLYGIKAA